MAFTPKLTSGDAEPEADTSVPTNRLVSFFQTYKRTTSVPALPLTRPAVDAMERRVAAYRKSLTALSRSLATSHDLDMVSESHVNRASQQLDAANAPRKKHVGIVGGLLAGSSLSAMLSALASSAPMDKFFNIGLLVMLVIGSYLIALGGEGRRP